MERLITLLKQGSLSVITKIQVGERIEKREDPRKQSIRKTAWQYRTDPEMLLSARREHEKKGVAKRCRGEVRSRGTRKRRAKERGGVQD